MYTPKYVRGMTKIMRGTSNAINTQQLEYQMTTKEKKNETHAQKLTKKCAWKHDIHTKNTT